MEPKPQWLTNTIYDPTGFTSTWPPVEGTTLPPEDKTAQEIELLKRIINEVLLPRLAALERRLPVAAPPPMQWDGLP